RAACGHASPRLRGSGRRGPRSGCRRASPQRRAGQRNPRVDSRSNSPWQRNLAGLDSPGKPAKVAGQLDTRGGTMSLTPTSHDLTRRRMLGGSAALLAGMAAGGGVVSVARGARAATSEVTFQLGWIMSNGQIGEVAGRSLGYFESEGINLKFAPGGPNVDGVAVVAAGSAQAGNLSSSPSLM